MNKSGYFGMTCHQALSFSPLLLRIPRGQALFWPGCALMNLDPALLERTLGVLKRAEPDIRLAAGCCGQPTVYLFPGKAERRQEKLRKLLRKRGVKRIYTACPNCTLQLGTMEGIEILPIWPVLAAHLKQEDIAPARGSFVWHDPCPTREDRDQQAAVRVLLDISGCEVCQPEHCGKNTRCCGNFHMLHCIDPEKSARIRARRLEDFPEDRTIASSCEGCLGAFRGEGRNTTHLLEILFGKSRTRGWINRFKIIFHR